MFKTIQNSTFTLLVIFFGVFFLIVAPKKQSPLAKYGVFFETVMLSENGVFRGLNLGVQVDSVLTKEPSEIKDASENYLYYEYLVDDIGTFNVAYDFNELGLNEIHADLYINDPEKTEELFNTFKTYFDEHYGPSHTDMGYTFWSVKSKLYKEVKINLSNESSDFSVANSPGKVSIWIYPDKE